MLLNESATYGTTIDRLIIKTTPNARPGATGNVQSAVFSANPAQDREFKGGEELGPISFPVIILIGLDHPDRAVKIRLRRPILALHNAKTYSVKGERLREFPTWQRLFAIEKKGCIQSVSWWLK
jgi:hypothetical protein